MAAKRKVADDQWCVVAVAGRCLDRTVSVFGPFTKGQALAVSDHRTREMSEECQVERLVSLCDHMSWLVEDV